MVPDTVKGGRSILRKSNGIKGSGCKSEGTVVQHLLSIVVGDGGSLNAKVSEHCIGFPSAEKADGIRVNARTEEGSGPARTEGSGGDFAGGDASGGGAMVCGMPQGIGNKGGFDGVPPLLVEVVVHEDRQTTPIV